MLPLIVALSVDCGTPNYPRVLYENDSAQTFTITETGALKFIQCGLKNAIVYAQMTDIPDMQFNLDLGVTKMEFFLSDIFFKDLSVEKVGVQFDGGE